MRILLSAAVCALLTASAGCAVVTVRPGPNALQNGMNQTGHAGLVILEPGQYGNQTVNGTQRDTGTIFAAKDGAVLTGLNSHADDVLYSGFEIDAGNVPGRQALDLSGDNVGLVDSEVGNVVDEKSIVSGRDITLSRVRFHDFDLRAAGTHMEAVYAMDVPGLTIRDSTFERNEVFDLVLTHRTWACPCPGGYGNVTLEGNRFAGGITYSVMAAHTDSGPFFACPGSSPGVPNGYLRDWRVVDNEFVRPTAYLKCEQRWDGVEWRGNIGPGG